MYTHDGTKKVVHEAGQAFMLPAVIEQTASRVFTGFSQRLKASLNGRQERALRMALEGHVTHKADRIFSVQSEDRSRHYLVDLENGFCSCPDSQKGYICKHRIAAYLIEQAMQNTSQAAADPRQEALEKARLALHARSDLLNGAIIYACLPLNGAELEVEVISLEGEAAFVRALPALKDGKLIPQFPFAEHKSCAQVLARSLKEITIYV